jgi:CspA family cold shock protein
MASGKVKWFNDAKAYGFLTPDDGGPDVFVHRKAIVAPHGRQVLAQGQQVEFDVGQGLKGIEAKNVRIIQ